jgi:hypothetical protein
VQKDVSDVLRQYLDLLGDYRKLVGEDDIGPELGRIQAEQEETVRWVDEQLRDGHVAAAEKALEQEEAIAFQELSELRSALKAIIPLRKALADAQVAALELERLRLKQRRAETAAVFERIRQLTEDARKLGASRGAERGASTQTAASASAVRTQGDANIDDSFVNLQVRIVREHYESEKGLILTVIERSNGLVRRYNARRKLRIARRYVIWIVFALVVGVVAPAVARDVLSD